MSGANNNNFRVPSSPPSTPDHDRSNISLPDNNSQQQQPVGLFTNKNTSHLTAPHPSTTPAGAPSVSYLGSSIVRGMTGGSNSGNNDNNDEPKPKKLFSMNDSVFGSSF